MVDVVPKRWTRDTFKTRSIKTVVTGRTCNILQMIVGSGDGKSTVIVVGGGAKHCYFLTEVCNGLQSGTPTYGD